MKKNPIIIRILVVLGLVIGLPGYLMTFFPLGTMPVFPLGLSLLIGAVAWFLAFRKKGKTFGSLVTMGIAVIGIVFNLVQENLIQDKVAVDVKQEQRIEQQKKDVENSTQLDDALNELDDDE